MLDDESQVAVRLESGNPRTGSQTTNMESVERQQSKGDTWGQRGSSGAWPPDGCRMGTGWAPDGVKRAQTTQGDGQLKISDLAMGLHVWERPDGKIQFFAAWSGLTYPPPRYLPLQSDLLTIRTFR